MELMLGEAFKIAVEVHGGQVDKAGEPYLFHVMRVAMAMETDAERVVAILHDTIEDTPGKLMSGDGSYMPTPKCRVLYRIRDVYGEELAHFVYALTRFDGEPYMDYIRRLSANPLAVKVKLADLADNMRRERMRKLPTLEAERIYQRYYEAYCFLTGEQWKHEDADAGGSPPDLLGIRSAMNFADDSMKMMSLVTPASQRTPFVILEEEISTEEATAALLPATAPPAKS